MGAGRIPVSRPATPSSARVSGPGKPPSVAVQRRRAAPAEPALLLPILPPARAHGGASRGGPRDGIQDSRPSVDLALGSFVFFRFRFNRVGGIRTAADGGRRAGRGGGRRALRCVEAG